MTARTTGLMKMKRQPSRSSRNGRAEVDARRALGVGSRRGACGQRERRDQQRRQQERAARRRRRRPTPGRSAGTSSASMPPSHSADLGEERRTAATRSGTCRRRRRATASWPSARWSAGTRFGTDASLAGDHSSVTISSSERRHDEAPHRVDERQRGEHARPRPRSQTTITFLRSQRSTSTPATGARKKPGHDAGRSSRGRRRAAGDAAADPAGDGDDGEEADPVAERRRRPAPATAGRSRREPNSRTVPTGGSAPRRRSGRAVGAGRRRAERLGRRPVVGSAARLGRPCHRLRVRDAVLARAVTARTGPRRHGTAPRPRRGIGLRLGRPPSCAGRLLRRRAFLAGRLLGRGLLGAAFFFLAGPAVAPDLRAARRPARA